jgi:hypothetical protein
MERGRQCRPPAEEIDDEADNSGPDVDVGGLVKHKLGICLKWAKSHLMAKKEMIEGTG